jgi:tetratricopeptide (TPR) repeat protein
VYRRDISSTLRILAVLLGAFVFYHIWTQPPTTPVPTPASLPATNIDATPNFPPALVKPAPTQDIPRTRLIEFGEAPSPAHQKIRDTLDRNEYAETESALRALGKTLIATPRDKAYVAALWNNLGVQQEKNGGIDVSVKDFKQAVALAPRNPTALLNLTQAYWGLRHPSLTPQFLEGVTRVVPDDPFPHLALAELLIDKGRHMDAVPHLKRARARIHRDSNLTALLEKLDGKTAKAALRAQQARTLVPTTKPAKQSPVQELLSPQAESPTPSSMEHAGPAPATELLSPANPASDASLPVPAPAETTP